MIDRRRPARVRLGGVLLHPTSLPSRYGIGDLGEGARRWIQWISDAGFGLWQTLPLGPTGYGDSPYQSFSALAGNPMLISPSDLQRQALLEFEDLEGAPDFPHHWVEFGEVQDYKHRVFRQSWRRFRADATHPLRERFERFCDEQDDWLMDYALFMAIKGEQGGKVWTEWPEGLAVRRNRALASAQDKLSDGVNYHRFLQFLFHQQWQEVRSLAHEKGITLVGDIPIFVAHDSVDVWVNQDLFELDESGIPTVVAGVPPDYFSETGQRWGNPLFRWPVMKGRGYRWWINRIRRVLERVDFVRLDHFRGFEGYWEIPAEAPTAETGRWVKAPGKDFLRKVESELGGLPLIAEDLGVITPEVEDLRDQFNLPGMKVLQFAFTGEPENLFLPHNHPRHCVVYTGTHDNDTSRGWYETAPEAERDFYRRYLGVDGEDVAWDLIRAAWRSVANWSIAPMQDILDLGTEARMNYPGRAVGNWSWRLEEGDLTDDLKARCKDLQYLYGR